MLGGVVGTLVRATATSVWPSAKGQVTCVLVVVVLASIAAGAALGAGSSLGALATVSGSRATLSVGFFAAICATAPPVLTFAYLVGTPVCVFLGLMIGMLAGLRIRPTAAIASPPSP